MNYKKRKQLNIYKIIILLVIFVEEKKKEIKVWNTSLPYLLLYYIYIYTHSINYKEEFKIIEEEKKKKNGDERLVILWWRIKKIEEKV